MIIKLTPATAQIIALCYQSMSAAQQYARSIANDPDTGMVIRNYFLRIGAAMTEPIQLIENRIPKSNWELFQAQIKASDPVGMDEMKSMFVRMTPEQQEWVERLMSGILKGELINFESIEQPTEI